MHLGSENNSDISADLTELSRNRMFVVSSGAKSILDLEKTYEKLETNGIPRVSYNSDYMPGFWYDETIYTVDQNFKNIDDIANYLKLVEETNHNSSVLIFNKVPKKNSIEKREWIVLEDNFSEEITLQEDLSFISTIPNLPIILIPSKKSVEKIQNNLNNLCDERRHESISTSELNSGKLLWRFYLKEKSDIYFLSNLVVKLQMFAKSLVFRR